MLPVGEVMTRQVVSVPPEATVDQAIELLLRHRVSGLPVVDSRQRLVGVVTEYDLLKALYDHEIGDQPVREHMSADPIYVEEDTSLTAVADLLLSSRLRRLPVVSGGRLVGLVSRHDLIRLIRDLRRRVMDRRAAERAEAPGSTSGRRGTERPSRPAAPASRG
jgi:CBS domain-containing protein